MAFDLGGAAMFAGHFAIAFLFIGLFPDVNPIVPLAGVAFPDLLWPILVYARVEKIVVHPDAAPPMNVDFTRYPFFHSLVLGTGIAAVIGILLAIVLSLTSGLVFVLASASHWLLDAIVHRKDLPVLGFGPDRKVGLSLWSRPRAAFGLEFVLIVAAGVAFLPWPAVLVGIVLGVVFLFLDRGAVLRSSQVPKTPAPQVLASMALLGNVLFIGLYAGVTALL